MTAPTRTGGRWELHRALGSLAERPLDRVADALGLARTLDPADHTHLFAFTALPYASAYLGVDGMLGGETAARVAGFWEAVGHVPPDPPDHLAALLDLYATLGEREQATTDPARLALLAQARAALLWEHLLPWIGIFIDLVRSARLPPWDRWADLLDRALTEAVEDHRPLPRHLAEAPPPLRSDFATSDLLVPARSGMVLTRADLAGAARRLGLGIRLTGRLPTLQYLLHQTDGEMIEWLSAHARHWHERHTRRGGPRPIDRFWAERAANTIQVLDGMLNRA